MTSLYQTIPFFHSCMYVCMCVHAHACVYVCEVLETIFPNVICFTEKWKEQKIMDLQKENLTGKQEMYEN